jgi:hypothetical protein
MTTASPKQQAFLRQLMDERQTERVIVPSAICIEALDSRRASELIDLLLRAPRKPLTTTAPAQWPTVHDGSYALREQDIVKFYHVSKPAEGRGRGARRAGRPARSGEPRDRV